MEGENVFAHSASCTISQTSISIAVLISTDLCPGALNKAADLKYMHFR